MRLGGVGGLGRRLGGGRFWDRGGLGWSWIKEL